MLNNDHRDWSTLRYAWRCHWHSPTMARGSACATPASSILLRRSNGPSIDRESASAKWVSQNHRPHSLQQRVAGRVQGSSHTETPWQVSAGFPSFSPIYAHFLPALRAWRKVPKAIVSPTARSGQLNGRGSPPLAMLRKSQVKAITSTTPDTKRPSQ